MAKRTKKVAKSKEKRFLVLGSSRGIGRAVAEQLLKQGASVCLHGSSDSTALNDLYRSYKTADAKVQKIHFDVTESEAAARALNETVETEGAFWGVVYSVGLYRDTIFAGMEKQEWADVINVSVNGFYNSVQPLVLPMIKLRNGGRIIALSSVSGITGNAGQVNYSAAKGALNAACKALAKELASRRIAVNAVAPGLIETEMADFPGKDEMLARIPMKRMGSADEVASLVNYLLSPEAEYMTGQILSINGGLV